MIFINAMMPDKDFVIKKQCIEIEDGIIKNVDTKIDYDKNDMVLDCEDFYIIPGFVDIHTHGCVMGDYSDGDVECVKNMAKFMLSQGVTSFCPTVMTMPNCDIENAILSINQAKKESDSDMSSIVGINLEGPFLSKSKKGAHKEEFLQELNLDTFKHFYKLSENNIKFVTVAPELDGFDEFVKEANKLTTVSIGHSDADYDTAIKAFELGAKHITHLFNAMTPLHHREPSIIGAFLESDDVAVELICDGRHVHKSLVKAMFKYKPNSIITISDSMRLCGEEEGTVGILGGQEVTLTNSIPVLSDGTLAGSASTLYQEFLNLVEWGIPMGQAIQSLTLNPAKALKMDKKIGSLEKNKKADMIILDKELNIVAV